MRVAIVHQWLVLQGGAERVSEVLLGMFPEADFFTLVMDESHLPEWIAGRSITTSFLNKFPGARRFYRHLLPLYPLAVEQLDLTSYDLVISADSGPVKGVITRPGAIHICYCHTPMRFLWDSYHSYLAAMPVFARLPFILSAHYVRNWEYVAAQRVTHFIANSHYVARRIKQYYGRSSTVVHPPVDTKRGFIDSTPGDYYLAAGRMVQYKRIDILIRACNQLGRRLLITGTGPEFKRLRAIAGPTIEFLGQLSTDDLWKTYARTRALLLAADEDFGLVPLETNACGRPVIAFGKGGALETVRALDQYPPPMGKPERSATGVFFMEQSPEAVVNAILKFEAAEDAFVPQAIQEHARGFDTAIFVNKIRDFLERATSCRLPSPEESDKCISV